jgi:NADH:ubiquinone oxidoreductase subunit
MAKYNIFQWIVGIQSPVTFLLRLWACGEPAGKDQFGNQYYRAKPRKNYNHERRWIRYASGNVEASEVPPEFHGWLHHQTNDFPSKVAGYRKPWQKEHTPNLTGTNLAYQPPGHELQGGQRNRATGDYEAWTPN